MGYTREQRGDRGGADAGARVGARPPGKRTLTEGAPLRRSAPTPLDSAAAASTDPVGYESGEDAADGTRATLLPLLVGDLEEKTTEELIAIARGLQQEFLKAGPRTRAALARNLLVIR